MSVLLYLLCCGTDHPWSCDAALFVVGELTLNVLSGCSVPAIRSQLFPPYFLGIVIEMKVSAPPHV